MVEHERDQCSGAHSCQTCGILVQKTELQSNSHNCIIALTKYLYKAIDEKDLVISNLREELDRKNKQIQGFLEKQNHLESRLQMIQEVLAYDDSEEEELEAAASISTKRASKKESVVNTANDGDEQSVEGGTPITADQIFS